MPIFRVNISAVYGKRISSLNHVNPLYIRTGRNLLNSAICFQIAVLGLMV